MYTVYVRTENFEKERNFFDYQNAITHAIEYAKCVDVVSVVVINGETGEIGLALTHGKIDCIGIIDF